MFPSVVVNLCEKAIINKNNYDCNVSTKATISSGTIDNSPQEPSKIKKKRNLPGNPDPDAEVIALSPRTLLATNRFVCEICQKGFQRDQNLQLHRRGHNLPWKLKQRKSSVIRKRAYVCPEPTCVHHHPSRALGDLTGIKKHFCRKHGEKKWKCEKCSKIYAVQSDWKAHSKTCGTREYRCDCGILFSRKDSFITHRAFCDALAEETARISANTPNPPPPLPHHQTFNLNHHHHHHHQTLPPLFPLSLPPPHSHLLSPSPNPIRDPLNIKPETLHLPISPSPAIPSSAYYQPPPAHLSATALLQKATSFSSHPVGHVASSMASSGVSAEFMGFEAEELATWQKGDHLTRDFLGLTGEGCVRNGTADANAQVREMLTYTGVKEYEHDHTPIKGQGGFRFALEPTWDECWRQDG